MNEIISEEAIHQYHNSDFFIRFRVVCFSKMAISMRHRGSICFLEKIGNKPEYFTNVLTVRIRG